MTEQQGPPGCDDAAADANPGDRWASWRAFFRVVEIRNRSAPQLTAMAGTVVALAVAFPWMTITHLRHGGVLDSIWAALLLIVDLTVLLCLPGLGVAVMELVRRARQLATQEDGPLLPRLAHASAGFIVEGRTDMGRWLDSLRGIVVLSLLTTPVMAAAVGALVTYEAVREDRPVGVWLLGPVVTFVALCVLPISVPAAIGSFLRRVRRETRG